MRIIPIFLVLAIVAGLAVPGLASAQEKSKTQEQAMTQKMTQEQMMAQMMKYANPVKEHEYLKKYVGNWDVEVKNFPGPGAAPLVSRGTMKGELLFGGRFVRTEFESTMMGLPFQGTQIIGYDLFQKKYSAIWFDNMTTYFAPTTGTLDPAAKIYTETGAWPDPMTGGLSQVKIVTTWLADGKYRFEMFMVEPGGKEVKGMEITYTKRAAM